MSLTLSLTRKMSSGNKPVSIIKGPPPLERGSSGLFPDSFILLLVSLTQLLNNFFQALQVFTGQRRLLQYPVSLK